MRTKKDEVLITFTNENFFI